jgi:hypothetical protein
LRQRPHFQSYILHIGPRSHPLGPLQFRRSPSELRLHPILTIPHHSSVQLTEILPMLSAPPLLVANPRIPHNRPSSSKSPSSFRCNSEMAPSTYFPKEPTFDDVVVRLQKLSIPSRSHSSPRSSPSFHPPPNPNTPMGGQFTLESPFAYPWPEYLKDSQDGLSTVIDSFAPRLSSFDLSPTSSSASSDPDLPMSSISSMSRRSSIDPFTATQSRVVRVSNMVSSLLI